MRKHPENKLAKPVADWLRERGFTVYAEVPWSSAVFDFLCVNKNDILLAVELKVSLTDTAFRQAKRHAGIVDASYVAVGTFPKHRQLMKCHAAGLGVFIIRGGVCDCIISAPYTNTPPPDIKLRLLSAMQSSTPSDNAGLPNMKGVGPAQDCLCRVEAYRQAHPDADRTEVFNNVPNHYSDANGMFAALRNIKIRADNGKAKT